MKLIKKKRTTVFLLSCVAHLSAGIITTNARIIKSEIADIDHDKQQDVILMTNRNGKTFLEIFLGGKGGETGKANIVTPVQNGIGKNLNIGDINGKKYIVVTGDKQRIFIFNPDDCYQTPLISQSANQWTSSCFIGKLSARNSFDILNGACLRRFTPPDRIGHGYFYGPRKNDNNAGFIHDLNLDGENDVIFTVRDRPLIRLYYAPFYEKMKFIPRELNEFAELKTPLIIEDIAVGDLNGDERPDIAAATLSGYPANRKKTYLFFQNSPTGFTNGASPDVVINGNGIPVIEKGIFYQIERKSGMLRIFRNYRFGTPSETCKSGLKDIHTFKVRNGIFLISGINSKGMSEIRYGKISDLLICTTDGSEETDRIKTTENSRKTDRIKTTENSRKTDRIKTTEKPKAVSFPHYMGSVYPAPQKARYGEEWISLKNVHIVPDGIAEDDLRIQFIQERIAELGGKSRIGKNLQTDKVNLILQLSPERHPRAQAYHLSADAKQKRIVLKAFDKTGLSWATGSFLQLTDKTMDGPAMRSAEIYDYPATAHRGYWSGFSDFKNITKKEWAKLHLLYKLDIMLLIRPWSLTGTRGNWKEWRKVSGEEYLKDYREMGKIFMPLGIEWCITTHPIEGKPAAKLDSSSAADFAVIYRQAENVISNGGSFMFQYDDVRYPRNPKEIEKYPNGGDADFAFISAIAEKLWEKYPKAKFYFCPPMYWGPHAAPAYPDDRDEYLKRVRKLSPEINFVWNGPRVCSTSILPADVKWAEMSYGRSPFLLIFGGGSNIERWHFFTEEVTAWPQWYYKGMEKKIAGALLGTNQPQFLMLTLTFADYWHNPAAYNAARSIRQAFSSLIGKESYMETQKVTEELIKMNEYGYQITPYFIRNQQKINTIMHQAEKLYKAAARRNPALDKWTTFRNYFSLFKRSLANAEKIDSSVFVKNTEQIRQYAEKETNFQQGKDILLTPYDFGGGANPLLYTYRCEKRLATYVKGKKTKISKMSASFFLKTEQLNARYKLVICGQDDDSNEKCPIRIELNGNSIFEGKNPFQRFGWNVQEFEIPPGILKEGANTLDIQNTADSANIAGPPFFMINYAVLQDSGKQHFMEKGVLR